MSAHEYAGETILANSLTALISQTWVVESITTVATENDDYKVTGSLCQGNTSAERDRTTLTFELTVKAP